MQHRTLIKGEPKVSVLAYGGSALSHFYDGFDESRGIRAVQTAFDLGINLFDTSPFYGFTSAETTLGKALHGLPRDRYFLATKVGRYGFEASDCDYSAARTASSINESLKRLQVDHVDFLQVHDVEYAQPDQLVNETIPALMKIKEQGKCKYIGISGLPLAYLHQVAGQAQIDQVQSYCHCCLNDTALLDHMPWFNKHQIAVFNAAPFAMRLLNHGTLPDWHPAPPELRVKCEEASQLCVAHGSDIATLALQFSVSHTQIPTTIVGTANPDRVCRYVREISEPIDGQLLEKVLDVLAPVHNTTWASGVQPVNKQKRSAPVGRE